MTRDREEALVRELVAAVPDVRTLYDEHLRDYGELLPHVLFGDLTRWVVAGARGTPSDAAAARRVVTILESEFATGDPQVQELIAVSFIENLPRDDEPGHEVRELLGPELASEAERLG